jgi:hypothetical protein
MSVTRRLEDREKLVGEERRAVVDQVAARAQEPVQAIREVPPDLLHPFSIRLRDDPGNVHRAAGESDDEQHLLL